MCKTFLRLEYPPIKVILPVGKHPDRTIEYEHVLGI